MRWRTGPSGSVHVRTSTDSEERARLYLSGQAIAGKHPTMTGLNVSAFYRDPLPLASVLAVLAAIVILTVWEPIQQRFLAAGTRTVPQPAAAWLDASFTTQNG